MSIPAHLMGIASDKSVQSTYLQVMAMAAYEARC